MVAQPYFVSGLSHTVIHDGILVTLHEYSNSITSQRVPLLRQSSSDVILNLWTVPEDQGSLQGARFVAAEVLILSKHGLPPPPPQSTPQTVTPTQTMTPRRDAVAVLAPNHQPKLHRAKTGPGDVIGARFEWCVNVTVRRCVDEIVVRAVSIQGQPNRWKKRQSCCTNRERCKRDPCGR